MMKKGKYLLATHERTETKKQNKNRKSRYRDLFARRGREAVRREMKKKKGKREKAQRDGSKNISNYMPQ